MVGPAKRVSMNPVALSLAPWLAVGWWIGTGLQLQQATLWSFQRVLVGLMGSALIGACLWGAQTHMRHWPAIFTNTSVAMRMLGLRFAWGAMACLMALSFVNARSWHQAQDALKPSLEGVDLNVVGEVTSLPQKGSLGVRFHFHALSAKLLGEMKRYKFRKSLLCHGLQVKRQTLWILGLPAS